MSSFYSSISLVGVFSSSVNTNKWNCFTFTHLHLLSLEFFYDLFLFAKFECSLNRPKTFIGFNQLIRLPSMRRSIVYLSSFQSLNKLRIKQFLSYFYHHRTFRERLLFIFRGKFLTEIESVTVAFATVQNYVNIFSLWLILLYLSLCSQKLILLGVWQHAKGDKF